MELAGSRLRWIAVALAILAATALVLSAGCGYKLPPRPLEKPDDADKDKAGKDGEDDEDEDDIKSPFATPTPPPLGGFGLDLGPAFSPDATPDATDPATLPPPGSDDDDDGQEQGDDDEEQ